MPTVRGDLLARLGRWSEVRLEFEALGIAHVSGRDLELLHEVRPGDCACGGIRRPSHGDESVAFGETACFRIQFSHHANYS